MVMEETCMHRLASHFTSRRGVSLVYATIAMTALMVFISLAVDMGRAQVAKTELQRAADAAARYGASGLSSGITTTQSRAQTAAADNKVDGTSVSLNTSSDLEFGTWDPTSETFTVLTGTARTSATAVRVTLSRSVPTLFAAAMGRSSVTIRAVAIATRGKIVPQSFDGDSCPWLAGMPSGSYVDATDGNTQDSVAPAQSPKLISGLTMTAGTKISFRGTTGTTTYADAGSYGPDGQLDWIVNQAACNGINTTYAPIQSVVGIFLNNSSPNTTSQAASLDFSTTSSRNFTTLSPSLKQVFFIGDGLNDSGQVQEFTVPSGATRLYIGIMDEKGWWWDNSGTITINAMDSKVQLVK